MKSIGRDTIIKWQIRWHLGLSSLMVNTGSTFQLANANVWAQRQQIKAGFVASAWLAISDLNDEA